MERPRGSKVGCIIMLVLLLIFAAIYFYAFREAEDRSPGPTAPTTAVG